MPEPAYSHSRDVRKKDESQKRVPNPTQMTNTQKVIASHSPPVWNLREESWLKLQYAGLRLDSRKDFLMVRGPEY